MQISVVNHQVPASPFTRCLVTGKSVRLLVPQLFFYKVRVLTYTFLLELSELKERKHTSESLWWRVFVACGAVEAGHGPRHLISTLPRFNTVVLVALLTWLDLTTQVSVQRTSPPRSRPCLRMASLHSLPSYSLLHHLHPFPGSPNHNL